MNRVGQAFLPVPKTSPKLEGEAKKSAITKANADAKAELNKVLTPEQQKKFAGGGHAAKGGDKKEKGDKKKKGPSE